MFNKFMLCFDGHDFPMHAINTATVVDVVQPVHIVCSNVPVYLYVGRSR